jgi:cytochrome c oxidase assembly protein subunit 15
MAMASRTSAANAVEGSVVAANGYRAVEIWLWCIAALVFTMIVVGGATRLTDSGLSITEWKPILGAIPPLNGADWQVAFEKYKQIPEYHIVNKGMGLEEFKFIFWWEWSHRFLGRIIGVAFALPLLAFWLTGRLRAGLPARFLGLLALGGLQGAIGWYMVSSGLSERVDVSQYRLALHLSVAMGILALVVWIALDERSTRLGTPAGLATGGVKTFAGVLLALIAVQIALGAFVAGLRAGLVYNTWPLMNGALVPSDYWIAEHGLLSLFDSHAAVQFNHRMAAYFVLAAAFYQAWMLLRGGASGVARSSGLILAIAVFIQAGLGIMTLVMHVPLLLGLMHQGGGALVLGIAVWHLYATRNAVAASVAVAA